MKNNEYKFRWLVNWLDLMSDYNYTWATADGQELITKDEFKDTSLSLILRIIPDSAKNV